MFPVEKTQILPGVGLTHIQSGKFKTGLLSLSLIRPLTQEDASRCAVIPYVLRRGTQRLQDMQALSAELDTLYGARLEPAVRKKGDYLCVGLSASFIDDAFVPEEQLSKTAALLGQVLLEPLTKDGVFFADYVKGEKDNLVDRIRAQINDKRIYARNRLTELMCADEPYGVGALGDENSAAKIAADSLYRYYQELLSTSRIELFYCGSASFSQVTAALRQALDALPRGRIEALPAMTVKGAAGQPRTFEEALDVTQGKLSIGFRTGVCMGDAGYPAMMLFNAVYGGTPNAKLFMNVREKLSLCYYASSSCDFLKGIMAVYSGIEFEKYTAARDEILAQLDACREGSIEPWELEGARSIMKNTLLSLSDSQGALEDYYLSQAVAGLNLNPESLVQSLATVTAEEVVSSARAVQLDTLYFLKGREKKEAAQ